jgi:EAL domain-containing protein (putative c-di-GMP-specific phosphodiesterase class I)
MTAAETQATDFVLHFAPKAEPASGCVLGVEALHAVTGAPRTSAVLAAALRQCGAWRDAGLDLQVAVNLPRAEVFDRELPDLIRELLAETHVRPDQLELEIPERTILADPFRVREALSRLGDLGLFLAIDDFGSWPASIAYLRRLPVHTIKSADSSAWQSAIDLGRSLDLGVVAEGVDSQETWDALRAEGCTLVQGDFVGKPLPADELGGLLHERGLHSHVARARRIAHA